MFKIIGADQKEYGPVSVAQIRQWITDGRLNANTQAQRAAGGDWQPLSTFEEFADIFNPTPAASAPEAMSSATPSAAPSGTPIPTASREMALSAVKGPAIALIVVGGIGVVLYFFTVIMQLLGGHQDFSQAPPWLQQMMMRNQGIAGVLGELFAMVLNGAVLFGAIKMLRLQSHTFAIVTCILAMLPCSCCCFLGLPFGIWGLIMLNKPEVKSQFTNL